MYSSTVTSCDQDCDYIYVPRFHDMLLALKGLKVYVVAENTSPLRLLEVRKSLGHEVWRSLPS